MSHGHAGAHDQAIARTGPTSTTHTSPFTVLLLEYSGRVSVSLPFTLTLAVGTAWTSWPWNSSCMLAPGPRPKFPRMFFCTGMAPVRVSALALRPTATPPLPSSGLHPPGRSAPWPGPGLPPARPCGALAAARPCALVGARQAGARGVPPGPPGRGASPPRRPTAGRRGRGGPQGGVGQWRQVGRGAGV